MFRTNRRRRKQLEITQLAEETSHDLKILREEMALARKKSVKNLRDEMKLARKLSFRRVDQTSINKPPCQKIEYSVDSPKKDGLEFELNFSPPCSPIQKYPTMDEALRLPSSRYFSIVLDDDELDYHKEEEEKEEKEEEEEEDRKPAAASCHDQPTQSHNYRRRRNVPGDIR